jgi:hypothetical protein
MFSVYWLKGFSGLFLNLSSGWFGAIFIGPLVIGEVQLFSLTTNLIYAIVSLLLHVKLEERLSYGSH